MVTGAEALAFLESHDIPEDVLATLRELVTTGEASLSGGRIVTEVPTDEERIAFQEDLKTGRAIIADGIIKLVSEHRGKSRAVDLLSGYVVWAENHVRIIDTSLYLFREACGRNPRNGNRVNE